jgi:hypothetical protein
MIDELQQQDKIKRSDRNFDKKALIETRARGHGTQCDTAWVNMDSRVAPRPSFRRPFHLHQQRCTRHKLLFMRLRIRSIWNSHKRHTCPQHFGTLQARRAHHFVLRHVHCLFQSQFSKQCHLVKFPVPSRFLKGQPVAAYIYMYIFIY